MRLIVGLLSVISPRASALAFGVDPEASSRWIIRLFGSRELALAAALLVVPDEQVPTVATVGAGIDAADLASSVLEFARGRISRYTLVSGGGGAGLFAVLGLDAARRARRMSAPAVHTTLGGR